MMYKFQKKWYYCILILFLLSMKNIFATNVKLIFKNKNTKCKCCWKNSKILYNGKRCPRCKLEQLSYRFPKTKIGEVSFFMTDALFYHMNGHGHNITWNDVNEEVVLKIKTKYYSILEKRKKNFLRTDLIFIGNEILKESFKMENEENLLKKRKCNKCERQRYELISPKCCDKNFLCAYCWVHENTKFCSVCKREMYTDTKQLHDLLTLIVIKLLLVLNVKAVNYEMIAESMNKVAIVKNRKDKTGVAKHINAIFDDIIQNSENSNFDAYKQLQYSNSFDVYSPWKMAIKIGESPWTFLLLPEVEIYKKMRMYTSYRAYAIYVWLQFFILNKQSPHSWLTNCHCLCFTYFCVSILFWDINRETSISGSKDQLQTIKKIKNKFEFLLAIWFVFFWQITSGILVYASLGYDNKITAMWTNFLWISIVIFVRIASSYIVDFYEKIYITDQEKYQFF